MTSYNFNDANPHYGKSACQNHNTRPSRSKSPTDSMTSTTSHSRESDSYAAPSFTSDYWPAAGKQINNEYAGFLSREAFSIKRAASGSPAEIPGPSNVPPNSCEDNQNGPLTGTFDQDVHTSHQPSFGPTRTDVISTRRVQPYGKSRARADEHWNGEVGPSTLVPLRTPYVGLKTSQSPGSPATTADADENQYSTEEDEAPAPKHDRLPRGQGTRRRGRWKVQGYVFRLCEWVQKREGAPEVATINHALEVVLEIIPTIRKAVYDSPRLATRETKSRPEESKRAKEERDRRGVERAHYEELSRYYRLPGDEGTWTRPRILRRVLKDLENYHHSTGSPTR